MVTSSTISLKETLFSLGAIVLVVLFPHTGIIPISFGYTIPVLIFTWYFLKQRKENFADLGFSFRRFEIKAALIGTIAGILIFSFLNWIFFPLLEQLVSLPDADLGGYNELKGNTGFYIFILIMAWLVGGFYEELIFHGFIFTRLQKIISAKHALIICFVLTNSIFALYHLQLGARGVINAFVAGLLYQAIMLWNKNNMWYAFFAHAIFDTIAITFLYIGYK